MSEEIKNEEVNEEVFVGFEGFEEESYGDAVNRKEQEEQEKGGNKVKIPRLDLKEDVEVRIAPLAPGTNRKKAGERFGATGWFMPQRSILLPLSIDGRDKPLYVSINAINQFDDFAGLYDVITTYQYEAIGALREAGRDADADKVAESSFSGGLKFGNKNLAYGFVRGKDKAPVLHFGSFSNTLVSRLEAQKMKIWKKWEDKGLKKACPISSLNDGCFVDISRINGAKVDYTIQISTDDNLPIGKDKDLQKALLDAPRLDKYVHYSRYQLEASIYFLEEYDAKFGLNICESEKFKDAVAAVVAILDEKKDDSKFDPSKYKKSSSDKDSGSESSNDEAKITIEDVMDGIEELVDHSFEELVELIADGEEIEIDESDASVKKFRRAVLSQFIKDNDIDVKLLRASKYPTPKAAVDVFNKVEEED